MIRSPVKQPVLRLAASLAVLAAAAASVAIAAEPSSLSNDAVTPAPFEWNHWRRRHENLEASIDNIAPNVLFLGDSITENWSHAGEKAWRRYLEPLGAANFGISGDRTQGLLWRIEHGRYGRLSPKVVVILIGTNNLKGQRNTVAETAAGIERVVDVACAAFPAAEILLVGVLPCDIEGDDRHGDEVEEVNQLLSSLQRDRVKYVDCADLLRNDDGSLDKSLVPDGLHPNGAGYEKLAIELAAKISEL